MTEIHQQSLTCRVSGMSRATHNIRILRLEPILGGRLAFRAGQYAALSFGTLPPRDFSMANRPDQSILEFHVRHTNDDGASGYVAKKLKAGQMVSLEGPYGEAWLRDDHAGPILCVAGGSGLAPIKSIVETALVSGMPQNIYLYFGARYVEELYLPHHFLDLAERYPNFRYIPVLSEPGEETGLRSGLVSDSVADDFPDFDSFKAYLAGPPVMVEATLEMLGARGLDPADVHADPFYSEAEKTARGLA